MQFNEITMKRMVYHNITLNLLNIIELYRVYFYVGTKISVMVRIKGN